MKKVVKILGIVLIAVTAASAVVTALTVYNKKYKKKYITVCQ